MKVNIAAYLRRKKIFSKALNIFFAGGMTIWWKRITGTWTDPATGRNYQDGYLVKGSELETGAKTDSYWVSINEWSTWKRKKEWQGHTFIEGDANPQAVK